MSDSSPLSPDQRHLGFLAEYGNFLANWSTFEVIVEIIIMRQLRLTPEEASIVCAALGLGAKMNLLCSLLNRNSASEAGVRLLTHAQRVAERNSFAHGFFLRDKEQAEFHLIRRDIKYRYEAKMQR